MSDESRKETLEEQRARVARIEREWVEWAVNDGLLPPSALNRLQDWDDPAERRAP